MGILNKLMFWKKEDDFDFDKAADHELGDLPKDDSMDFDQKHLGLEEK